VQLPGGAQLLYADANSDAMLMRLNNPPPAGAVFSGWDAATIAGGTAVTAVHHPDGDLKKVSLGTIGGFGDIDGGSTPTFIISNWNSVATGVTEAGSSGSGLFTAVGQPATEYRLRGGLYGGPSSCTAPASDLHDYYSRFDQVYPSIAAYLNPSASGGSAVSYEGLWLKGDESGWGVNVTHQGTTLFATWFTYDTDFTAMWLVASSLAQTSAGNFSGALYRTVGPGFNADPFNSITFPASYTQVGTLTFAFTDANNGTMSYTVNGVSQSKPITRFLFSKGGTNCTMGGTQGAVPNYTDLWLRSANGATEAGWGVNIAHQGDILFATWFTYLPGSGSSNKGMWLVMSNGNKTAPGVYSGALQTTTGPPFSAQPFSPNSVARTTVGSGTFTFTDANNGTFSYTVNGVSQSKPIARYIYASPSTVCQ
jgi:hypothetical protein